MVPPPMTLLTMATGTLILIPTPLGEESPVECIPATAIAALASVRTLLVENERSARRALARLGLGDRIGVCVFRELSEHTRPEEMDDVLAALEGGTDVGVLSEAGCPVIADPGSSLVRRCHERGIRVAAHVGPSSVILAVMASGFSGQTFAFRGYLPIPRDGRVRAIRELERRARDTGETQVFMETPYRNQHLLEDLLATCDPGTALSIACELTTPGEYVRTRRIREWVGDTPPLKKRPALFLLGR